MFTHRMDGCTFAAGSPTANGDVLVGHFNRQFNGRTHEGIMRAYAKETLGNDVKLLGKSQYLDPNNNVSVFTTSFGFKENNKWKFYYQRYQDNMGSYQLLGVTRLR
jgi:hypothetical protein